MCEQSVLNHVLQYVSRNGRSVRFKNTDAFQRKLSEETISLQLNSLEAITGHIPL